MRSIIKTISIQENRSFSSKEILEFLDKIILKIESDHS